MARPKKKKDGVLELYISALQAQYPKVKIQPIKGRSPEADFWVRVEAPESIVLDVVDSTAGLSYDWYIKHKVNILASVSSKEDGEPPGPAVKDLYTT